MPNDGGKPIPDPSFLPTISKKIGNFFSKVLKKKVGKKLIANY